MTPPEIALPAPSPDAGPIGLLRKYAKIFRVTLIERMTYRADFLLTTFLRFLPMLTTILLWQAIYSASGEESIENYRYDEMIAYLLLVNISRMFSSMPGLAGGIAREIRDGSLKKYLLQPLDMLNYLLSYRVAHKVSYIIASAIPYGILFYLCRGYFVGHVPADPQTWLAYAASLILAFFVGFYFEAAVGMVGFWFLEVTSLLFIVMTLNFFVSGHMLPLDLLGPTWSTILKALPFQYMAYFPAVVFLKKVQGAELLFELTRQALWALAFWALSRWLYRKGLRHYGAYGG
ncbi:MAG: ABC-2 family transporter protein [Isosphaeraceae bacterium]